MNGNAVPSIRMQRLQKRTMRSGSCANPLKGCRTRFAKFTHNSKNGASVNSHLGGKLSGLDASIAALRSRGVLLVDDMDLSKHDDPELRAALKRVRGDLLADTRLVCAELEAASGMILATRR